MLSSGGSAPVGDQGRFPASNRITVALIPVAHEHLQRLEGISRTDLVNRAITLYEFFDSETLAEPADGQSLVRVRRDELVDDLKSGAESSLHGSRWRPIANKSGGHAFISYVREDAAGADWLQRELEAAGIRVWRDTEELWPGEDWRAKVRKAITGDALVFIACFSRNSVSRDKSYQNEELLLAIEQMRQRKPDKPWLIPVRFDDCVIPDWDIGAGRTLSSIQRADLFGDGDREIAVGRLVTSVLRLL